MNRDTENKLDFKDKLFTFYKKNKLKIISLIIFIIVIFSALIFINESQKKKKTFFNLKTI